MDKSLLHNHNDNHNDGPDKDLRQNDDKKIPSSSLSSHHKLSSSSYPPDKLPPLKPMSNIEVIEELNNLRSTLGLKKTDDSMRVTREIVKTKGSLLDVWDEMKQRER